MNEDREYTIKRTKHGMWMGYTFDTAIPQGAIGDSPTEVVAKIDSGEAITANNLDAVKVQARQVLEGLKGEES